MNETWERRWQALTAALPQYAVLIDRVGRLLWANHARPGRRLKDLLGRRPSEILPPKEARLYVGALRRLLRTRKPQQVDLVLLGIDGDRRTFSCVMRPVFNGGRIEEVLVLGYDNTEKLAVERGRSVTARVVAAAESERKRVSMELHDSVSQLLAAVSHGLRAAQGRMSIYEPAADDVRRSSAMLTEAIEEVRRIARNLRPPLLDDLGLIPALRVLAQEFTENSRIKTTLDLMREEPPVNADAKLALYRIAQEALSNADRHSGASRVRIRCGCKLGSLRLSVEDDGRGFELSKASAQETLGLANLRERAALVSGELSVRSSRGQGTTIEVTMPLGKARRKAGRR